MELPDHCGVKRGTLCPALTSKERRMVKAKRDHEQAQNWAAKPGRERPEKVTGQSAYWTREDVVRASEIIAVYQ
jgi:hypothetical protein